MRKMTWFVEDVNDLIFDYLDNKSLNTILQIDQHSNKLNNNNFWLNRINRLIPALPVPEEYQDNIKDLYFILKGLYKSSYQHFIINSIEWSLSNGHLNLLQWFHQKYNKLFILFMYKYKEIPVFRYYDFFKRSHFRKTTSGILKWLIKQSKIVKNNSNYRSLICCCYPVYAGINGDLEILKYLYENNLIDAGMTKHILRGAVENMRLDTIKWVCRTYHLIVTSSMIFYFSEKLENNLEELLNFLYINYLFDVNYLLMEINGYHTLWSLKTVIRIMDWMKAKTDIHIDPYIYEAKIRLLDHLSK